MVQPRETLNKGKFIAHQFKPHELRHGESSPDRHLAGGHPVLLGSSGLGR
jgi:hypothetical protein